MLVMMVVVVAVFVVVVVVVIVRIGHGTLSGRSRHCAPQTRLSEGG